MHDKNGKPLKVGDKIRVEFVIKETAATEDYCNVKAESVEPFYPDLNRHDITWFNAKQVEKVEA